MRGAPAPGRTTLLTWAARAFTAGPVLHLTAGPRTPPPPGPGTHTWLPEQGADPHTLLETWRAAAGGRPLLICADDAHRWSAAAPGARGAGGRARCGAVGLAPEPKPPADDQAAPAKEKAPA
ncbi:LuxR family transcriptional regulator, partial [Streptomyces mexicanus]